MHIDPNNTDRYISCFYDKFKHDGLVGKLQLLWERITHFVINLLKLKWEWMTEDSVFRSLHSRLNETYEDPRLTLLLKLAIISMKEGGKNPSFTVDSETAALKAAEKNPDLFFQYYPNSYHIYVLPDSEQKFKVAEAALKAKKTLTSDEIQKFKLNNEHLASLALTEISLSESPIPDLMKRYELKTCNLDQISPIFTAMFKKQPLNELYVTDKLQQWLDNWGFQDDPHKIKLAKWLIKYSAKDELKDLPRYIQKFGIQKEGERLGLALSLKEKDETIIASRINDFDITHQDALYDLAWKLASAFSKKKKDFLPYFSNFKLENEKERYRIAEICLPQDPNLFCFYIKELNLSEEHRFQLAIMMGNIAPSSLKSHISNFDLEKESYRFEAAKLCATCLDLRDDLEKFYLSKEHVSDLIKICAQQNLSHVLLRMDVVGKKSNEDLKTIYEICAKNYPASVIDSLKQEGLLTKKKDCLDVIKQCLFNLEAIEALVWNVSSFNFEEKDRIDIAEMCAETIDTTPNHNEIRTTFADFLKEFKLPNEIESKLLDKLQRVEEIIE